ncbi:hypothetical protein BDF22DRAFT_746997 [Syncephalis plumigaleata]|nr:hypothetical protein BDF22DRAFT_746997 [Syncephalis plumigaleata]
MRETTFYTWLSVAIIYMLIVTLYAPSMMIDTHETTLLTRRDGPASNSSNKTTKVEEADRKSSESDKDEESKSNIQSKKPYTKYNDNLNEENHDNNKHSSKNSSSNKTMETDTKDTNKSRHQANATNTNDDNTIKTKDGEVLDASHPPGRLVMLEPQAREHYVPRYRIGEVITFKWKYDDNLKFPPKNLTIQIAGPERQLVTIAANISGDTTEYKWDTNEWDDTKSGPLLEYGRYQLVIFDERGKNALPEGGHLLVYRGTTFGLSNVAAIMCTVCAGASSLLVNTSMLQLVTITGLMLVAQLCYLAFT